MKCQILRWLCVGMLVWQTAYAAPSTYSGKPLSMQFENVEVRALLQAIADFTSLNVVVSEGVKGQMSIKLQDVPWDQALDMVLQARGLVMQRQGQILWVGTRAEMAEREKQHVLGDSAMQGLAPLRTQVLSLHYAQAQELVKHLSGSGDAQAPRILSPRGSAFAQARTNQLLVTDIDEVQERVRQLVAQLDIPVRQVMIEARIVEADDNWGKSVGARLSLLGASRGAGVGNDRLRVALQGQDGQNRTDLFNLPAVGQNGMAAAALALSVFAPGASQLLGLEISALEADGQGQLLSSPKVLTMDQHKAVIEQGTELPYQVAGAYGSTSIEFRKANLKLEVVPRITPGGQVLLDLNLAKDAVGRVTSSGYAIDTKHVQTQVLVQDGGTLVIGGIFELAQRNDMTKVPLLGDVPILGHLFRQRTQAREKREMMVFITPTIVDGALGMQPSEKQ